MRPPGSSLRRALSSRGSAIDPSRWRIAPRAVSRTLKSWPEGAPGHAIAEHTIDGKVLRLGYTNRTTAWRVDTLFAKEPMTLEWLHSFGSGQVMVDVGANIGLYSLYAAVVCGAKVYAFEPESQNYAELHRNIALNDAFDRVTGYCAAVGDKTAVSTLLLSGFGAGKSHHDFAESSRTRDVAPKAQGAVSFTLDMLIESRSVPAPDHVKIDVDGHEAKVIKGMRKYLESGGPKTILLECDPSWPGMLSAVSELGRMGYQCNPDELRVSRLGILSREFVEEAFWAGKFSGNAVFSRDPSLIQHATRYLDSLSQEDRDGLSIAPDVYYAEHPSLR